MTDEIEKIDFEHADPERVVALLEVLAARNDDQDRDGEELSERELAEARARIMAKIGLPAVRPPASRQRKSDAPETRTEPETGQPASFVRGWWATAYQRMSTAYARWCQSRFERLCSGAERLDLKFTEIDVASSAHWETTSADARKRLAQLTDVVQQRICHGSGARLQRISLFYAIVTFGLLLVDVTILGSAVEQNFAPTELGQIPGAVRPFGLAALAVGVQAWLGTAVGEHFRKSRLGLVAAGALALLSALNGIVTYEYFAASPAAISTTATIAVAAFAAACVVAAPWLVALLKHSATAVEVQEMRRLRRALCRRDSRMLRAYQAARRRLRSALRIIEALERRVTRRPSGSYAEMLDQMRLNYLRASSRVWETLWSFSRPYLPTALENLAQMHAPSDPIDKASFPVDATDLGTIATGSPLPDVEWLEITRDITEGRAP